MGIAVLSIIGTVVTAGAVFIALRSIKLDGKKDGTSHPTA